MSQPAEYSLPGVMRYLQTEWQRNERDRIQWELERAEMKTRIAKLEGEKRGLQLLVDTHLKRIKTLEQKMETEEGQSEGDVLEQTKQEVDSALQNSDVDLSPLIESRQYLEKCIQEVEYLLQSNGQVEEEPDQPIMSKDVHPSKLKSKWTFKNSFTYPGVKCAKFWSAQELVTGGDDGVRVWDIKDGTFRDVLHEPRNCKIEVGTNTIYTLGQTKTGWINIQTGDKFLETDYATDLSLYGKRLATANSTKIVKLYDAENGNELSTITSEQDVHKVLFQNRDRMVLAMSDKLSIVDVDSGAPVVDFASPTPNSSAISDMCFSINEVLIVGYDDGTINQYDPKTGALLCRANHGSAVASLSSAPISRHFVTASATANTIKVWTVGSAKCIETLSHQQVQNVQWHSANLMATCGNNVVQTFIK